MSVLNKKYVSSPTQFSHIANFISLVFTLSGLHKKSCLDKNYNYNMMMRSSEVLKTDDSIEKNI